MKHTSNITRNIVVTALMAALTCVATMVIQVPSPMQGYVNLGDGFVLLSGILLGPLYGTAAAGIGSMFADLLIGYAHYAPGTLLIKAAAALAGGLIYQLLRKVRAGGKVPVLPVIAAGIGVNAIVVVGYFGYASLLLGKGLAAAASIPGNIIQGIFGIIVACILVPILEQIPAVRKFTSPQP
ncbi:ECF transporter S component [Anaerolentibacter hominis]|uniref:ECF transporter S component n=1 Tax=Anaerolentibacter hominis TaxID=3079009 RepID=UPI0031B87E87